MADYDPLIPQANDLISQSQADILNNFTQLNTIFNNDHWTWDSSISANRGYHRQISFPTALGSDPSLSGRAGYIFLKNDANDASARPQVYYKNITETLQVTNRFHSAVTNGYIQLPGGIILMWGTAVIPNTSSGQVNVTFPVIANYTGAPSGFPNNVFNIQISIQGASSNSGITYIIGSGTPPTSTGFQFRFSNNTQSATLYWYAIGN